MKEYVSLVLCKALMRCKKYFDRARGGMRGIVIKLLRNKTVYYTACYIIRLLPGTLVLRIGEARREYQVLSRFLSVIVLAIYPLCFSDLTFFANSFGSTSGWCSIERNFSAVRLPIVGSKSESETAKEALKDLAVEKLSSWTDVGGDLRENGLNCSSMRHPRQRGWRCWWG